MGICGSGPRILVVPMQKRAPGLGACCASGGRKERAAAFLPGNGIAPCAPLAANPFGKAAQSLDGSMSFGSHCAACGHLALPGCVI